MTRPGIEPRSPGPLVNTLPIWVMSRFTNNSSNWSIGPIDGTLIGATSPINGAQVSTTGSD